MSKLDSKGMLWSHGKHIITIDDKGIWKTDDNGNSWFTIGCLCSGFCNVYTIYGINDYDFEKYVAVPLDIFKYRQLFKIKSIRREFYDYSHSSRGQLTKISYGYIPRSKMKSLLAKRKVLKHRARGVDIVLVKKEDWEFHSK